MSEKQVVNIEVDKDMYRSFKAICVKKSVNVKDAIEKLMKSVVKKEQEKDVLGE